MGVDLIAMVKGDHITSGTPVDLLVEAATQLDARRIGYRLDYPYIAGYALSSLELAAKGISTQAELATRAAIVALLLCRQDTFDAIVAAAHAQAVPA